MLLRATRGLPKEESRDNHLTFGFDLRRWTLDLFRKMNHALSRSNPNPGQHSTFCDITAWERLIKCDWSLRSPPLPAAVNSLVPQKQRAWREAVEYVLGFGDINSIHRTHPESPRRWKSPRTAFR